MGLLKKLETNIATGIVSFLEKATGVNEAAATTELSTYKSPYYLDSQLDPYNPDDLVHKKGYEIFDEMEKDEQIKASFELKKRYILSKGFDIINPEDVKDDVKFEEYRKFIEDVFGDLFDGVFINRISEILSSLKYGFSITEKVFKILKHKYPGKIGLKDLKTRPPHSIEMSQDEYGNLTKIIQNQQHGTKELQPLNKFIIYPYRSKFGNPFGESDFKSAYTAWFFKQHLMRYWGIFNERYGMPFAVGKYKQGTKPGDRTKILNILKSLQAKSSAVISDNVAIEFLEAKGTGINYRQAVEVANTMISRSFLIPELMGYTEHKSGSQALGETQKEIFSIAAIESVQTEVEDLIFEHLIKDLININFGEQEFYPRLKFRAIDDSKTIEKYQVWGELHQKGIVESTETDENRIREDLGMPPKDIEDDEEEEGAEKDVPEKEPGTPKKEGKPGEENKTEDKVKEKDIDKKVNKEEKENKGFAEDVDRPFTSYEKKVDFKEIVNTTDELQHETGIALGVIVTGIKESLYKQIEQGNIIDEKNFKKIKALSIPDKYDAEMIKVWKKQGEETFKIAREEAMKELSRGFTEESTILRFKERLETNIGTLTTKESFKYVEDQAFRLTGTENAHILKNVRNILYTGVENGFSNTKIVHNLEEFFDDYTVLQKDVKITKSGIKVTEKPIQDIKGRLTVVTRTNIMKFYNMSRMATFQDPILKGFVEAFQYSAVIDIRTTNYCADMDGRIVKSNNPDWSFRQPPAHFQCRSILVPVTVDEPYEESKFPAITPAKGFGG